ncbi:siderophore-interacting protein [Streptomyces deccanensis]|uniref:siderophore-interacting protein n=1 Tax=Streptomyces deccanensis TaxID=424188 RepID=UPI001EFBE1BA|nr:siderophore-interacting protein [Streptomyces deccanensis]ULR55673.1 siderophore-interacting protein [Streptomyces deccanensis]
MPRYKSPTRRRMLRATVSRTERTSPSFVTLTLQGPDLADFDPMGADQSCRLFFRRDGQRELAMPTASHNGWLAQFLLMRPAVRPWVRLYTVRAFRPDACEMDIEFVLHGGHGDHGAPGEQGGVGPASAFALRARPGDPVGLFPEGIGYLPTPAARSQLLVGDESAVPAILFILEQSPHDLTGDAYLEVPTADDVRAVTAPDGVTVHWLPRDDHAAVPGQLALRTVTSSWKPTPDQRVYCWVAGESGLPTGLRRHLVKEGGVPKSDISFLGYWKHGRSSHG